MNGEVRNPCATGVSMSQDSGAPRYDLEERTFLFAKRVRAFVKGIAKTLGNIEDAKQGIRSSGSIGSNYIEANEAISKKDRLFRLRVSRKEAKESRFWLRLMDTDGSPSGTSEREKLIQESTELMKILGAILRKSE